MISALLLVFDPVKTWERIVLDNRSWVRIAAGYLFPLLLLVATMEGYGLINWGKARVGLSHTRVFSVPQTILFEIGQLILSFVIVLVSAWLIKSLGETFHGRHTFAQTFTVAAYGLSPVFTLRIFNAFQGVSQWVPWVCWGIGVVLTFSIIYHGLPMVMKPDPPHAFGLFLTSGLFLTMITGLACLLTAFYVQGKFTKLDHLIFRFLS